MANVTKRDGGELEEGAAQPAQNTSDANSTSLQDMFAQFENEIQHQLKVFRATSGERTKSNSSGANSSGNGARSGTSGENHRNRGRASMMLTISDALAQDIQSGGPLARAIQQTYSIGRTPTQR